MSVMACRMRAGYSQYSLMQTLGCSSLTVQRWDNGIRPNRSNVERLCALFGVDEAQLLQEEPTPAPDMAALLDLADRMGVEAFCKKMNLSELTVVMWREGAIAQPGTLRKIAARLDLPVADLMK